jgi:hypothetical protein
VTLTKIVTGCWRVADHGVNVGIVSGARLLGGYSFQTTKEGCVTVFGTRRYRKPVDAAQALIHLHPSIGRAA